MISRCAKLGSGPCGSAGSLTCALPALPGAVRAHHHPHHECCRETLWLPLRVSDLPVFVHAYVSHPVLKLLFPGKLNVNVQW